MCCVGYDGGDSSLHDALPHGLGPQSAHHHEQGMAVPASLVSPCSFVRYVCLLVRCIFTFRFHINYNSLCASILTPSPWLSNPCWYALTQLSSIPVPLAFKTNISLSHRVRFLLSPTPANIGPYHLVDVDVLRDSQVDQFTKVHDFARAYGSLCWNMSKVIPRKDLPR